MENKTENSSIVFLVKVSHVFTELNLVALCKHHSVYVS